jgi:hypothetical protein
MKSYFLAAGAAAVALTAGAASAATKHHHAKASSNAGNYAEPSQPVAYSKLDSYLKTSPTRRKKEDWSLAAGAPTGTSANTSATMGSSPEPQAGAMYQQPAPSAAPDNSGAMSAPAGSTAAPPATGQAAPATPPADQTAPPTTGDTTTPAAKPPGT